MMLLSLGRSQQLELIAFHPYSILSKDTAGSGPIPPSVHLKTLNKGTLHVSPQAPIGIHVFHTR